MEDSGIGHDSIDVTRGVREGCGAESGHMNRGYLSHLRALKTSVPTRGRAFFPELGGAPGGFLSLLFFPNQEKGSGRPSLVQCQPLLQ